MEAASCLRHYLWKLDRDSITAYNLISVSKFDVRTVNA